METVLKHEGIHSVIAKSISPHKTHIYFRYSRNAPRSILISPASIFIIGGRKRSNTIIRRVAHTIPTRKNLSKLGFLWLDNHYRCTQLPTNEGAYLSLTRLENELSPRISILHFIPCLDRRIYNLVYTHVEDTNVTPFQRNHICIYIASRNFKPSDLRSELRMHPIHPRTSTWHRQS